MSTGDLKNNLRKLQAEVKKVNFNNEMDFDKMSKGSAEAFLPILHHAFINYSRTLAAKISEIGIEMFGKSDLRFVEAMYKVLRELFSYKPPLTKDQFLNIGYAERKIIMCAEILAHLTRWQRDHGPKVSKLKPSSGKTAARLGPRPATATGTCRDSTKHAGKAASSKENPVPRVVNQVMAPPIITVPDSDGQRPKTPPCGAGMRHTSPQPLGGSRRVTFQEAPPTAIVRDSLERSSLPPTITDRTDSVEVISMGSSFTDQIAGQMEDDWQLRPIDIVATTPARSQTIHHKVAAPDPDILTEMTTKMDKLVNVIKNFNVTLESLHQRVTNLESKYQYTEQNPQKETSMGTVPPGVMESLLARIALLENKFAIQDQVQKTAETHPRCLSSNRPPAHLESQKDPVHQIQTGTQSQVASEENSVFPLQMSTSSPVPSQVDTVHQIQTDTSSLMPHQVNMVQHTENGTSTPPVSGSKISHQPSLNTSSPPLDVHMTSTPKEEEMALDQRQRILMMLRETEGLLGIQASSPYKVTNPSATKPDESNT